MKMCPIKEWVARDGTSTGGPLTQLYTIIHTERASYTTIERPLTQLYRGLSHYTLYSIQRGPKTRHFYWAPYTTIHCILYREVLLGLLHNYTERPKTLIIQGPGTLRHSETSFTLHWYAGAKIWPALLYQCLGFVTV